MYNIEENEKFFERLKDAHKGMSREKTIELIEKNLGKRSSLNHNLLEKIENGRKAIDPYTVLELAQGLKAPHLCNDYCAHVCPIGQEYTPTVTIKELANIVLEMLSTLNTIESNKNRLIDIAADGKITDEEYKDFVIITKDLERMSITIKALQLWIEKMKADGVIDTNKIEEIKKELHLD